MKCLVALAIAVVAMPALAQQPAREPDRYRQVDEGRDNARTSERYRHAEKRARCPYGVAKPGSPHPCAPKPQATRPGDPNPYATRAGDPNPFATKAGAPNPYATRAGDPNPYGPPPAGTPRR
jgi:hypothetical protein